jgi:hypothetical protein
MFSLELFFVCSLLALLSTFLLVSILWAANIYMLYTIYYIYIWVTHVPRDFVRSRDLVQIANVLWEIACHFRPWSSINWWFEEKKTDGRMICPICCLVCRALNRSIWCVRLAFSPEATTASRATTTTVKRAVFFATPVSFLPRSW